MEIEHLNRRYQNDAEFHSMVQCMYHAMDTLGLTPSELREAASFTAYIHERENVRRLVLLPSEYFEAGEHISQHDKVQNEKTGS